MKTKHRYERMIAVIGEPNYERLCSDVIEWGHRHGVTAEDVDPGMPDYDVAMAYADKVAGIGSNDVFVPTAVAARWEAAYEEAWAEFFTMAVEYATGDRKASV